MSRIEDFKDAERWAIETTLRERSGDKIDIPLADSDIRLRPTDGRLTPRPPAYCEVGDRRYRCQFYDRLRAQYGTGVNEYDDLREGAVSLLQAQADHERAIPQKQDAQRQQPE